MFLGHFALGFMAKRIDPKPSLGSYFLAAQFVDLLWPLFLLAGVERVEIEPGNTVFTPLHFVHYPFTHSLFAVGCWALLFAVIYFLIKRHLGSALLMGVLVLSHWVLDVLSHRPDLPLSPWNDMKMGLGLWNYRTITIMLEIFLFALGCYLYLTATLARNTTGRFAVWGFMIFMVMVYFINAFGPPPDSSDTIAFVGLTQWILVAWGYWIDSRRYDYVAAKYNSHFNISS